VSGNLTVEREDWDWGLDVDWEMGELRVRVDWEVLNRLEEHWEMVEGAAWPIVRNIHISKGDKPRMRVRAFHGPCI
jgi:hypothetical protein